MLGDMAVSPSRKPAAWENCAWALPSPSQACAREHCAPCTSLPPPPSSIVCLPRFFVTAHAAPVSQARPLHASTISASSSSPSPPHTPSLPSPAPMIPAWIVFHATAAADDEDEDDDDEDDEQEATVTSSGTARNNVMSTLQSAPSTIPRIKAGASRSSSRPCTCLHRACADCAACTYHCPVCSLARRLRRAQFCSILAPRASLSEFVPPRDMAICWSCV